jgi:hypothetical protein
LSLAAALSHVVEEPVPSAVEGTPAMLTYPRLF